MHIKDTLKYLKKIKTIVFLFFFICFVLVLPFLISIVYFITVINLIILLLKIVFLFYKSLVFNTKVLIKPIIWEPVLCGNVQLYLWMFLYYKPYILSYYYVAMFYKIIKLRKAKKLKINYKTIAKYIFIYIYIYITGFTKSFVKYTKKFIDKFSDLNTFQKKKYIRFVSQSFKVWAEEMDELITYNEVSISITPGFIFIHHPDQNL